MAQPSSTSPQLFAGIICAGHKEAAIEVPFDPHLLWGMVAERIAPGRRGYRVAAVVNDVAFDSFVVARSRRFRLLLDNECLERIGLQLGERADVSLAPSAIRA